MHNEQSLTNKKRSKLTYCVFAFYRLFWVIFSYFTSSKITTHDYQLFRNLWYKYDTK